jgi:hypothetical protein
MRRAPLAPQRTVRCAKAPRRAFCSQSSPVQFCPPPLGRPTEPLPLLNSGWRRTRNTSPAPCTSIILRPDFHFSPPARWSRTLSLFTPPWSTAGNPIAAPSPPSPQRWCFSLLPLPAHCASTRRHAPLRRRPRETTRFSTRRRKRKQERGHCTTTGSSKGVETPRAPSVRRLPAAARYFGPEGVIIPRHRLEPDEFDNNDDSSPRPPATTDSTTTPRSYDRAVSSFALSTGRYLRTHLPRWQPRPTSPARTQALTTTRPSATPPTTTS